MFDLREPFTDGFKIEIFSLIVLIFKSKVMLSAASPYFKAMFTGGLKESEMATVKLQGVSILIKSIYIWINST